MYVCAPKFLADEKVNQHQQILIATVILVYISLFKDQWYFLLFRSKICIDFDKINYKGTNIKNI